MLSSLSRSLASIVFLLACLPAQATFHLWAIDEIFSNADGTVQFVELSTAFDLQNSLSLHTLTARSGPDSRVLVFDKNLPGSTAGKKFLVGTDGFAALGVVMPDYTVPNGFLFIPGGTLDFAGWDIWNHGPVPTDGVLSLNRNGTTSPNSPTNFAGQTGQIVPAAFALTVVRSGTGTGTVSSNPPGIACGGDCAESYTPGTPVTLAAMPASGSLFGGWSGACTGTGTCELSMTAIRSVTAAFTLDPADTDGDGIPNGVEVNEGRNPLVKDNDVFGNARLFSMQQYRDFLSREGDPAGITGWTNLITGGTYSRLQVINSFLLSDEFAGVIAPVVRLYFATFLRVPDYDGLTFNAGLVRNGTVTLTQLADFFTASPEFAATYGALDNTQFVTLLYSNVLGRAPDAAGLNGWVSLLGSGYTRGQVLLGFSDSVEYQAAMANKVFVTMMYAGMLRRTPEPTGFIGWVGFLDAATLTREQVINGFFLSTEYRGRFLP